jgi:hypothetical protein
VGTDEVDLSSEFGRLPALRPCGCSVEQSRQSLRVECEYVLGTVVTRWDDRRRGWATRMEEHVGWP